MKAGAAFGLLALAVLAAACGGGGGGGGPLPPGASHPVTQNQKVKFSFTIPAKSVSAKRRPETISPSTQSIGITVNGGTQQTFDALATSPGCAVTQSGIMCTVSIDAAPGSDTFVVNTYSGTGATGAILDSTTFVSTIVMDALNTLNIVLGPVVSTTADSGPGSLRQAIADANAGDTVTFLLTPPATITLTSGEISMTKNVTLSGPASATITVSGNNASRIFNVGAGVHATISNLTLTHGAAPSGNGGAIDNFGALTLSSVQITNSSALASPAPVYGGGIAVENGASLTVTGSTISGNQSYRGGGIWEAGMASPVSITGSTLSNNTTTNTQQSNDGGALYVNVATTLTNDTVTGNSGSAISVNAPLTISGGTYSNNTAKGGDGGALYVFGVTNISNATFDGNVAGDPNTVGSHGKGGAIESDYDVTIDNTTFSNNVAGNASTGYGYGGAIDMSDGNLTVTNSHFTSNSAGGTNANYGYGGAINDTTFNRMSITGSTFTSNSAGGTGYGYGGALELHGQLTLDGDSFSQNAAYGSADGYAYGGAADVNPTIDGEKFTNATFTSNKATGGTTTSGSSGYAYGGALSTSGSAITLDGDSFSSNAVTGAHLAEGGALYSGGIVNMSGGTFDSNTATVGIAGCSAVALGGGATFGNNATLSGVSLTNNKALITATHSTGFCLTARPRRSPKISSFATNIVYGAGGALEFCSCATTFTFSGTVSGNSAATDGGGLDLRGGTAVITGSTIDSNTVTASPGLTDGGGGIYLADSTAATITGSTISNNSVAGNTSGNDGGGGVMLTAPASMTNDTITGNSAAFGGDIYSYSTSLTLTNVTLMNGTATASSGAGGDFYGEGVNTLTIAGNLIAGGIASTQNNLGGNTQTTTIVDNGYNVINTSNSSMNGASDFDLFGPSVDPLLSALASNGGPTKTMADGAASPGTDFIPVARCTSNGVTTDQRGNTRGDSGDVPPGGRCDAGAYEYP